MLQFVINIGAFLWGIYLIWMANFAPDATINRWRKSALIQSTSIPTLRRSYGLFGILLVIISAISFSPN